MERIVNLEGHDIGLKVSAGTVRAYRDQFGKDLIQDMGVIEQEILANKTMTVESSQIAENIIWLMAKEYDPDIEPIDKWLGNFGPYFIYGAVVYVITMWRDNIATLNKSKKKI